MMVLGSIVLLTAMVVEFAYNSHVTYTMAHNDLDRLKAYYLARSALGFAKLQVKIEKDIRKQLANYAKYLAGVVGSEPICKMMPFSTDLLRGVLGGGLMAPEEGAADEAGAGDEGEEPSEPSDDMSFEGIMAAAAAGDFLEFDGNFAVSCDVEDRKMNLNFFYGLAAEEPVDQETRVNSYESHKRLLESLLTGEDFEEYFEDEPEKRRKLVNNIADWVDTNTLVDESPGFQSGYEDRAYEEFGYKVKNGKFSTPGELLLVTGMTDEIYQKLSPNVTIYGDEKVNVCLADEEMVKAFVIRYSNTTEEVDPILPDNSELLDEIVAAVQQACLTPVPKALEVANAIRTVLNLPPETSSTASTSTSSSSSSSSSQSTSQSGSAGTQTQTPTVSKKLTEQISTENRFYSFDLTGSSGDIILNIKAILHTEDKDPNKWKMLFFRVQ